MDTNVKYIYVFTRILAVVILTTPRDIFCQEDALIPLGTIANITTYPYHVVIYEIINKSEDYRKICGGTLISTKFVVSAAHCFWNEQQNKKKTSDRYKIRAGTMLSTWSGQVTDCRVQERQISDISLPRRFLGRVLSYENDIAVAALNEALIFTESVQMASIDWQDTCTAEQLVSTSQGVVAGWGVANSGKESNMLRVTSLPYVDPDTCFDSLEFYLKQFVTHDKYCAGFANRTVVVCSGDSGGGLVFHHPRTGTAYLRGVVSVGFKPAGTKEVCFAQQYTTFTMVKPGVLCGLISNLVHGRVKVLYTCRSMDGEIFLNKSTLER